jgi:hypothetical protein
VPVSRQNVTTTPERLRPYLFHGVDLEVRGSHAVADCPFCGKEGKFSVEVETGLWKCWSCGCGSANGGGNGLTFVRLHYERCFAATRPEFYAAVARDRRLMSAETVVKWGMCADPTGAWLVPGYGVDGVLDQLYLRVNGRLLPTPCLWEEGKAHALHMSRDRFDASSPELNVMEGPWDGMAADEVLYPKSPSNIVAVPGCGTWRDEWTEASRGKRVTLFYDSDHPRSPAGNGNGRTYRAGYDAMRRVAGKLSGVAASVRFLRWGADGYDPERPSGWDVRDVITGAGHSASARLDAVGWLLSKVEDAPRDWFTPTAAMVDGHPRHAGSPESLPCSTWAECEGAWRDALHWRADLSMATATLLAVCASTRQAGNQLFLDLVGSPGSAKTTLCRGLLVSGHCVHLENVTKLVSGWKKPGEDDKDCSFLARANNKTWVTCEFDVLASSPQYHDLMGKVRRIFDGETSTTYGNTDEDRVYTALRTPWIRAGTLKMLDHDQSQLGDRFLRFIIGDPEEDEKREISRRALRSERAAMLETANCTSGSTVDPKTRRAHALTGGYVDWLRANVEEQLARVDVPEYAEDYCIDLAQLAADLRARPVDDRKKSTEVHPSKELPTRLARQNVRLASCLAVVLNKAVVDAEVLHIVRKVALDTSVGNSLNIVRWMCSPNPKVEGRTYQECGGIQAITLGGWCSMVPERTHRYLAFLRDIGVLELRESTRSSLPEAWALTGRMLELYTKITGGQT